MNSNRSDRGPLGTVVLVLCFINILLLLLAMRAGSSFREHFIPGPGSAGKETAEALHEPPAGDILVEPAAEATTEALPETTAEPTTEAPAEPEYDGVPFIELAEELPALSQDDLEGDLVQLLADSGALTAEDGYGEDLTPEIRAEVRFQPDAEPFGTYRLTLRAENRDGTEATAQRDVSVEIVKPVLELDTYELTLERGEAFNSLEHVVTATDIDGNRDALFRRINVDGDVNTYAAGTYEVRYRILSMQSDADARRTLTVIVK